MGIERGFWGWAPGAARVHLEWKQVPCQLSARFRKKRKTVEKAAKKFTAGRNRDRTGVTVTVRHVPGAVTRVLPNIGKIKRFLPNIGKSTRGAPPSVCQTLANPASFCQTLALRGGVRLAPFLAPHSRVKARNSRAPFAVPTKQSFAGSPSSKGLGLPLISWQIRPAAPLSHPPA